MKCWNCGKENKDINNYCIFCGNLLSYSGGFDFDYLSMEYIYIRNRNYNIASIKNCFKILKDCASLINTTAKPKVFFERYLLAISILNELIPIENKIPIKGDKPSKIKYQFYEKEILTVNDFIDRYYSQTLEDIDTLKTDKAKLNKIEKYLHGLDEYKQYINPESMQRFTNYYLQLKQSI